MVSYSRMKVHTVWSDTNCAYGLIGVLALDYLAKRGKDPSQARFALHQCTCEIGRDHTKDGRVWKNRDDTDHDA